MGELKTKMGILDINEEEEYIKAQPEGTQELLFAMFCGPCYTCARTRYGCKASILWVVISTVISFLTAGAATGAAAASSQVSAASRTTDDVIADLTQELANCQADSNESLNTQSLLARLERDIDNME